MTTDVTTSELDQPYDITQDQIERFRQDGFIKLSHVLSEDTVNSYEPDITGKLIELNTQDRPMEERSTYEKAFLQVTNLWPHSERVREFVHSRRLAKIAADLLEVQSVRLFADQGLYKEPSGGITPWHADQYHWPLSSDRSITVWVPLQPTPVEMGPLSFAIGSHKHDLGRDFGISDESEAAIQKALADADFHVEDSGYELGDVSYHLGWTFHRARPNLSTEPRRVMTIIYVDADITITEPRNPAHHGLLDSVLTGAKVGGRIETPMNPVLYDRSST